MLTTASVCRDQDPELLLLLEPLKPSVVQAAVLAGTWVVFLVAEKT